MPTGMTLINLVEQCDLKLTSAQKSFLSTLGVVDNPVQGLLTLEDYLVTHNPQPGDSFVCLVPVGICFSDSKYNRSDRIHFGNIIKHLKRMMGFSYKAAGILSGFLRLNREQIRDLQYGRASSQYIVVVTKGNHRVTKRYAVCNNPNAYIPVEVTIHKTEDYDEMVRIESLDHTLDAAYRTSQNQEDKFKSSYYAQELDAINLYNFLHQFSIGISDTNPSAKFGFFVSKIFSLFVLLILSIRFLSSSNIFNSNFSCLFNVSAIEITNFVISSIFLSIFFIGDDSERVASIWPVFTLFIFINFVSIDIFLALDSTFDSKLFFPKNLSAETLLVVSLGVLPSLDILLRKFSYTGEVSSIRVSLLLL